LKQVALDAPLSSATHSCPSAVDCLDLKPLTSPTKHLGEISMPSFNHFDRFIKDLPTHERTSVLFSIEPLVTAGSFSAWLRYRRERDDGSLTVCYVPVIMQGGAKAAIHCPPRGPPRQLCETAAALPDLPAGPANIGPADPGQAPA
jgi:hypothetical protein